MEEKVVLKNRLFFTVEKIKKTLSFFSPKNIAIFISAILLGLLIIFILGQTTSTNKGSQNLTLGQRDNRYSIASPIASTPIYKEFSFPITGASSNNKIQYNLETAELRLEILIKGEKASAVKGKEFLIINLKLKNNFNQNININTRDYIRLVSKENPAELLAPEIYNDPVEVQAISTKYTRLGFPVNEGEKEFQVQVGEINGDKTTVDLIFN